MKLSAMYYAVASFFVVPLTVTILAVGALAIALAWPIIPFVAYAQRRDELKKGRTT